MAHKKVVRKQFVVDCLHFFFLALLIVGKLLVFVDVFGSIMSSFDIWVFDFSFYSKVVCVWVAVGASSS